MLVKRPKIQHVIGCRWVLRTKFRADGSVERRKARLVAKGYSQLPGIELDLNLYHGDLEEEVYMVQAPWFETNKDETYLLKRAIYGLRQSGRQWFKKLDEELQKFGLKPSKTEKCIYYMKTENFYVVAVIFVDDLTVGTNNQSILIPLKETLNQKYKIKNLGNLH